MKKDFRLFPNESPKDGIGCSLNIPKKMAERITSKIKSVLKLFYLRKFTQFWSDVRKKGVPKKRRKNYI